MTNLQWWCEQSVKVWPKCSRCSQSFTMTIVTGGPKMFNMAFQFSLPDDAGLHCDLAAAGNELPPYPALPGPSQASTNRRSLRPYKSTAPPPNFSCRYGATRLLTPLHRPAHPLAPAAMLRRRPAPHFAVPPPKLDAHRVRAYEEFSP